MLRDAKTSFGATTIGSASASASATVNASDYIDLEAHRTVLNRDSASTSSTITADIGENGMIEVNAKVTTAITSSTSSASTTLNVRLHHHTAGGVSTIISSGAVLVQTGATVYTTANKAAGAVWLRQRIPAGTVNRYLTASFVTASGKTTAGAIQLWIGGPAESPK